MSLPTDVQRRLTILHDHLRETMEVVRATGNSQAYRAGVSESSVAHSARVVGALLREDRRELEREAQEAASEREAMELEREVSRAIFGLGRIGRIPTVWNIPVVDRLTGLGSRTGRFSSDRPNMQEVPHPENRVPTEADEIHKRAVNRVRVWTQKLRPSEPTRTRYGYLSDWHPGRPSGRAEAVYYKQDVMFEREADCS